MKFTRRSFIGVAGVALAACNMRSEDSVRDQPAVSTSKHTNFNTFAKQAALAGGAPHMIARKNDTWESLFGGRVEVAKYANRQNVILRPGQYVLRPSHSATKGSLNPFPSQAYAGYSKMVVVSPYRYAWALYQNGSLTRWGPAVCGADFCSDVGRACRTPSGRFVVSEAAGPNRRSNAYPPILAAEGRGALMPYYMRLTAGGVGMHARYISGRHASHGCIGMFYDDAEWLNLQHARRGHLPVIVEGYTA